MREPGSFESLSQQAGTAWSHTFQAGYRAGEKDARDGVLIGLLFAAVAGAVLGAVFVWCLL